MAVDNEGDNNRDPASRLSSELFSAASDIDRVLVRRATVTDCESASGSWRLFAEIRACVSRRREAGAARRIAPRLVVREAGVGWWLLARAAAVKGPRGRMRFACPLTRALACGYVRFSLFLVPASSRRRRPPPPVPAALLSPLRARRARVSGERRPASFARPTLIPFFPAGFLLRLRLYPFPGDALSRRDRRRISATD